QVIQRLREIRQTTTEISTEIAISFVAAPLAAPLQGARYIGWAFRTPGLRGVLWGAATDLATQTIMVATGERDGYDFNRTLFAAGTGGALDFVGTAFARRFSNRIPAQTTGGSSTGAPAAASTTGRFAAIREALSDANRAMLSPAEREGIKFTVRRVEAL